MMYDARGPADKVVVPLHHQALPWFVIVLYVPITALALYFGGAMTFAMLHLGPAPVILGAVLLLGGLRLVIVLLKNFRLIPHATVVIEGDHIYLTTPILGKGFTHARLRVGEPVTLRQGPLRRMAFPGYFESFFLEQGENSMRYAAVGRLEWPSLIALKRELSARRTALEVRATLPSEWADSEEWFDLDAWDTSD